MGQKGNSSAGSDRGLARKRRLCGLTQHAVAQQANVPLQRITYAETGRIDLEPDERERIKNVFRNRVRKAMDAVGA
jgi:hypothetical protein